VRDVSIKALVARTGLRRNTVRAALRAAQPPKYERAAAGSKLDPFKDEIHRLLKDDSAMPRQRIRERIAPLGFAGGKTIVDDYLREVRPLFVDQRRIYRPPARFASSTSRSGWTPTATPGPLTPTRATPRPPSRPSARRRPKRKPATHIQRSPVRTSEEWWS
jgi:hypothetical protein